MSAVLSQPLPAFLPALPEMFLVVSAMALLLYGVFRTEESNRVVAQLAIAALLVTAVLVLTRGGDRVVTFNGLFVADGFAAFTKTLCLVASALAILLSQDYLEREHMNRFEYPVLVMFASPASWCCRRRMNGFCGASSTARGVGTMPSGPRTTPKGLSSCACVAGPPSPAEPFVPLPAKVETVAPRVEAESSVEVIAKMPNRRSGVIMLAVV